MKGKIVVVTGASGGIGRAIALRFAKEGARIALVARRKKRLEEVKAVVERRGGEGLVVCADISRPDELTGAFGHIRREWGDPEILVNNAGCGTFGPLVDSKPEEFDRIFNLNVRALYLATREVLPAMIRRRKGAIINIASVAGKVGLENVSIYCASKFAVMGLSEALLEEVRKDRIRVSVNCPGLTETEFFFGPDGVEGDLKKFIRPEDIAEAACLCAREEGTATFKEIVVRPRVPV